jgi:hypothetical protein
MSTSSIMHNHTTPYAAAAAVIVAAVAAVSFGSLSLSGSDQPSTTINPPSTGSHATTHQLQLPTGGGHLTGGA